MLLALTTGCDAGADEPPSLAEIEAFIGTTLPPNIQDLHVADETGIDRLMRLRFDAPQEETLAFAARLVPDGREPGTDPGLLSMGSDLDWWLNAMPPGAEGGGTIPSSKINIDGADVRHLFIVEKQPRNASANHPEFTLVRVSQESGIGLGRVGRKSGREGVSLDEAEAILSGLDHELGRGGVASRRGEWLHRWLAVVGMRTEPGEAVPGGLRWSEPSRRRSRVRSR